VTQDLCSTSASLAFCPFNPVRKQLSWQRLVLPRYQVQWTSFHIVLQIHASDALLIWQQQTRPADALTGRATGVVTSLSGLTKLEAWATEVFRSHSMRIVQCMKLPRLQLAHMENNLVFKLLKLSSSPASKGGQLASVASHLHSCPKFCQKEHWKSDYMSVWHSHQTFDKAVPLYPSMGKLACAVLSNSFPSGIGQPCGYWS